MKNDHNSLYQYVFFLFIVVIFKSRLLKLVSIYRPLTLDLHGDDEEGLPMLAFDSQSDAMDWQRWDDLVYKVRFLLPLMYTWCFNVANPDPHLDTVFPYGWIHFWSEL